MLQKAWADLGAGTTARLKVKAQQDQIVISISVEKGGGWPAATRPHL